VWAPLLIIAVLAWRTREEVMTRTYDSWTGKNSQTWIEDFIAGNPHLALNVPDGRAISRGEHGVYMPRTGEVQAKTEARLSWPHDLVMVEIKDARSLGQERTEFVKQVLDDFNAFSAALPPRSN